MSKELKTAIAITKYLNKTLMKRFKEFGFGKIKFKKHQEIVTSADLEMNKYIIKKLLAKFPDYDIVSEESEEIDNPGTKKWYLDPLDGTTNFAYGFPDFSTCLGLAENNNIILGVIGLPYRQEIFWTEKGKGAWCNGRRLQASKRKTLKESLIMLCAGHSPHGRQMFDDMITRTSGVGHVRLLASAGIELSSVASGRADAVIITEINAWDVIGGVLLIREAGGRVTNFVGQDWKIGDSTLVASNGLVHGELLKLVKDVNPVK